MVDGDISGETELEAGNFSSWVIEMQGAIRGERGADVPCAGCTACCTSSQFVHIGPKETDTLSHIPAELKFPAPGLPRGHVVLGYDERGHCPMLIDGKCSIYEHRPRTCRTYDCRVFPAAGVDADDDQMLIAERARRWRFNYPTPADETRQAAVRLAVRFLEGHLDLLPPAPAPRSATQLPVIAIEIHDLFLQCDDETGETTVADPDLEVVRAALVHLTA